MDANEPKGTRPTQNELALLRSVGDLDGGESLRRTTKLERRTVAKALAGMPVQHASLRLLVQAAESLRRHPSNPMEAA